MKSFGRYTSLKTLLAFVKDFYALEKDQRPFSLRLIVTGFVLLGMFLLSFSTWSMLVPLESAVVSRGIVSVSGYRKEIQHLEGGIVESIHVKDGDKVKRGQLLIQLNNIKPVAKLKQLEMQKIETQAVIARLLAEINDSRDIIFPDILLDRAQDPSVSSVLKGQKNILESNSTLIQDKQSVLNHKIIQADVGIKGLQGQVDAKKRQKSLIDEELLEFDKALSQNLVAKPTVLRLRQRLAEVEGDLSTYHAKMGGLEQSKLEFRLQISKEKAARIALMTTQLRNQRAQLYELSQKMTAARDVLQRTKIVSPIDGVVVNLQIHTRNGVIAPGQSVLDVVPTNDELVVYAFINPDDIDEVRSGMNADIRLTSLNRRRREPLSGVLTDVSADRLTDADTGKEYYRARIELIPGSPGLKKATLLAGMGADVFIQTGARTPLEYMLEPITRSLQYGLREN